MCMFASVIFLVLHLFVTMEFRSPTFSAFHFVLILISSCCCCIFVCCVICSLHLFIRLLISFVFVSFLTISRHCCRSVFVDALLQVLSGCTLFTSVCIFISSFVHVAFSLHFFRYVPLMTILSDSCGGGISCINVSQCGVVALTVAIFCNENIINGREKLAQPQLAGVAGLCNEEVSQSANDSILVIVRREKPSHSAWLKPLVSMTSNQWPISVQCEKWRSYVRPLYRPHSIGYLVSHWNDNVRSRSMARTEIPLTGVTVKRNVFYSMLRILLTVLSTEKLSKRNDCLSILYSILPLINLSCIASNRIVSLSMCDGYSLWSSGWLIVWPANRLFNEKLYQ